MMAAQGVLAANEEYAESADGLHAHLADSRFGSADLPSDLSEREPFEEEELQDFLLWQRKLGDRVSHLQYRKVVAGARRLTGE